MHPGFGPRLPGAVNRLLPLVEGDAMDLGDRPRGVEVVLQGLDDALRELDLLRKNGPRSPFRKRLRGLAQAAERPVDRLAIMRLEHGEAHDLARPVLEDVPYRHEIPRRLRHLLPLDLEEAVVEPVVGHDGGAVGAARLRDLVLVVGEDEVDAAAVDVEDRAEQRAGHRRALDVPAGTAPAPTASPRRARRASTASRGRSRSGPACRARPRRGRPPPSRRGCGCDRRP